MYGSVKDSFDSFRCRFVVVTVLLQESCECCVLFVVACCSKHTVARGERREAGERRALVYTPVVGSFAKKVVLERDFDFN